ncbi:hypothetical protein M0804_014885 [Polistes exclamans]|nr:hypothetical protein M0804_014885 [Polistes exclamans]
MNNSNNSSASSAYNYPTNNNNPIKIAAINVNSFVSLSKRLDLLNFIKTNNLEIILVDETKLNKKHKIQFKDYNIIRSDRSNGSRGGGMAIIIKCKIQHETIFFPTSRNNTILEYTIIKIKSTNNTNLILIALYANNKENKTFTPELEQLFSGLKLNSANNYYLMTGDLNARSVHWGDSMTKMKGNLNKI